MSMFEVVALFGAISGLSMILGGMWLIAKGAMKLAETAPGDALTVEWMKKLRISTQAPGIAFFIIGLAFITLSLWFTSPSEVEPIVIDGQIEEMEDPDPVTVSIQPVAQTLELSSDGQILAKVYPDTTYLVLRISAPGHVPFVKTIPRSHPSIGKLKLRRMMKKEQIATNVQELPFEPPPLASERDYNFGVAQ